MRELTATMKSNKSSQTTPATSKVVFAVGRFLFVTPSHTTRCRFVWNTIDGMLNGLVELKTKPEFVEYITFSSQPRVEVEVFDLKFRVPTAGYNKTTRTLHLLASGFFRGIAKALDRRGYAGVDTNAGSASQTPATIAPPKPHNS
jgi:hypothetical protein